MDRKFFLGMAATAVAVSGIPMIKTFSASIPETSPYKLPPYLKKGDTIGITSPAGSIKLEEIQPAIRVMETWGYNVKIGAAIGKKDYTFGGNDDERLNDLQALLNDHSVKAIMCARGGYGCIRIVDGIDWTKFIKHPKWIIGFSDITVLLNHIHHNLHIAALHSKMCNSFPSDWSKTEPVQLDSINSIKDALVGKTMEYKAVINPANKAGSSNGILVGGNLKTIESLSGTLSDINTNGKILFVEDTGEYLYSLDRMFWNLSRTGKLSKLKGLIVGSFNVKADDPGEEFGKNIQDIVLEKVKEYSYPVVFDFPVGHQHANYALKCGVKHHLRITDNEVTLTEIK